QETPVSVLQVLQVRVGARGAGARVLKVLSTSSTSSTCTPSTRCTSSTSSTANTSDLLLQLRDHRGDHFEQIANDAVVRDLENGRFGILVDRDDRARTLHPDEMLDGARDAEGDVEL